nr:HU-CCDC81 and SPOR domain-containing protein [Bacteroidota bacterium]
MPIFVGEKIMVQMDISKHISLLLFDHDCVILPGLGGFVCNYSPANVHPAQHAFSPPSKTILFNSNLKTNDGLLANYISMVEKISYKEALVLTENYAKSIILSISRGEKFILENIGSIDLDKEANIQFEQNYHINYLKDVFGLTNVVSPAIARSYRKNIRVSEPEFIDRKAKQPQKNRALVLKRIMVVIPVIIVAGFIFVNFNNISNIWKNETTLVPTFAEQKNTALENKSILQPGEFKDNPEKSLAATMAQNNNSSADNNINELLASGENKIVGQAEILETTNTDDPLHETQPVIEQTTLQYPSSQKMWHLIGGSFQNIENAENLVKKYLGENMKPRIIGQAANGYYRVSIAAYMRRDVAIAELNNAREKYNDNIWILRY